MRGGGKQSVGRWLRRERRWLAGPGVLQTRDEIVELTQPPLPLDVPIPIIAQLTFDADALDCLKCLVDLGVVRLMRMSVNPVAHMIGQSGGCVTGARRGQLGGRDRFTRFIETEVLRLAHRAVKR